jgi:hypothetical protein
MYSGEDSQANLYSRKLSPVASPRLPNERNPMSTAINTKRPQRMLGPLVTLETLMVQRMVRPRSARRSVIGFTITLVPTLTRE